MTIFLFALLAQVADSLPPARAAAAAPPPAFALDTLRPADGPVVLRNPTASPLVGLRLVAPVPADVPAGAAELVQELARPAASAEARRFGAALEFDVVGDDAILTLTGPASAFDALAGILRLAVAEPDLAVAPLRIARSRAEDRVLAALERPEPRLRSLLRARLAARPATGPDIARLDPETIRGIAGRLYDPERARVLLVGDVPDEIVLSALARWPTPAPGAVLPPPDTAPPLPRPQVHNVWAALAYPLDTDPAVLAVAAELVAARVRAAGLAGTAEAWVDPRGGILALLAGAPDDDPEVAGAARITAFPVAEGEDRVSALARYLRRLIAEAAALASPGAVADAAFQVRRGLLLDARSPAGRVAVVTRWSGAHAGGVHGVLGRLDAVSRAEVRALLDLALATTPIRVEVLP